jgi:hypothetical protein
MANFLNRALLMTLFVGAASVGVWYFSPTVLPWIINAAESYLSLDVAFLGTMNTIAASATVASVGTGLLAITSGLLQGMASLGSWAFGLCCFRSNDSESSSFPSSVEQKETLSPVSSPLVKMSQGAVGPGTTPEVIPHTGALFGGSTQTKTPETTLVPVTSPTV